jgi:hypothetical protein
VLAEMSVHQTRAYFNQKLNGKLVDNPQVCGAERYNSKHGCDGSQHHQLEHCMMKLVDQPTGM